MDDVTDAEIQAKRREIDRLNARSFWLQRISIIIGMAGFLVATASILGEPIELSSKSVALFIGLVLGVVTASYLVRSYTDEELKELIRRERSAGGSKS